MRIQPHKATVIGGLGFIGKALVADLLSMGWDCWVPEREYRWPELRKDLGHVFYCAGLTADYLDRPAATVEAHIGLLSKVLQSTHYTSLVYLSSTRLYDGLPTSALANENAEFSITPMKSRHFYDLTKLTGENLCHIMGRGRAKIARLSCVYDNTRDARGFLPELIRKLACTAAGTEIRLASSPYFARDYVHISDVVRALVSIATKGTHSVYNVASGQNLLNIELANWISIICDRAILFDSLKMQKQPPHIDVQRLKVEFDWRAEDVLKKIEPWLRALSD